MSRAEQSRAAYIDFVRIVACMFVIFNHTNERGFYRYCSDTVGSVAWIIDTFISQCCKAGVPLFFMISGMNLLNKNEGFKRTFSRCKKILICLFVWEVGYYCLDDYLSGVTINPGQEIVRVVNSNYWHLWYLYAYIGFIICLPLLRLIAQNIQNEHFILLAVLGVILLFACPIFEFFIMPIQGNIKPMWVVADIVLYPVMGFYLDKRIDIQRIAFVKIIMLWVGNLTALFISMLCE